MKTYTAYLLVVLLIAVTGCGSGGVTGVYVAEKKDPDGQSMKLTLELKRDGVAILTIGGPNGESLPPVTGTYTVEGDKIVTVLDNDRDEYLIEGDTLTTDFFDEKLVLKKQ